ncbi:helix-turn-helix domain-containing protein [Pedobacter nutrimenti]|uniref:HTH cro/C1-type domain-containing protein n=1 Tax=Pedobacter nutrimenti TaxID=1241337 RepID=A0A318UJH1_9SPHI|nr:helix-turn-helix transcriptional regulator [Pedobacter nutrimenti]PYF76131.1 hypothetical protein B0O44_102687 [Pedobacter nutrimenti]
MAIEENIKFFRIQKEYDVQYVAGKLGMTVEEYELIESGTKDITYKQLEAIAEVFVMTTVDLIQHNDASVPGIKNYFFNQNGNNGINVKSQGVDPELIAKFYDDLYHSQLKKIPVLESLLRDNNIDYNF